MGDRLIELESLAQRTGRDLGDIFEDIVGLACQYFPHRGDCVADVGAHAGAHTFTLSRSVGWRGAVYAFEPLPFYFSYLGKRDKKRLFSNIRLINKALGRTTGKADFCHFTKYPAFSGLERRHTPFSDSEGGREKITVDVARMDEAVDCQRRLSFLKLDIEGGELDALAGGKTLIEKNRPVIVFENGRHASAQTYGYTDTDFFAFFSSISYRVFAVTGWELTPDKWHQPHNCWEYVALPAERASEVSIFDRFCDQVINSSTVRSV